MYLLILQYAKIRQEEIEREIKAIQLERLARRSRKSSLPLWRKCMVKLGRWFVSTGAFLQKRYGLPASSSNSGDCPLGSSFSR